MIAVVDFLKLVDSIAAQAQALADAMGDGTGLTTASYGAVKNIEKIQAYTDPEQIAALLSGFIYQRDQVEAVPHAYYRFAESCKALGIHVGGVDAYLTTNGARVAPQFKTVIEMCIGEFLSAANTFSPVVDPMGSLAVTGANSATYTPGTDIDTDNYYAALCEIEKTSAAGAADAIAITFKCTKWDDTEENKVVNVDASDILGSKTNIGNGTTDMYKSITMDSITCGAGSAGQTWKVLSKLERAISLNP